eukprot:TRINITY_DN2195_c2_g1_i2.p5 TRINITY_DN2195_c2_g1~~TRINITY_DN2195_c2_g1_i2.p5  ORF type:complete len:121 (-),score=4.49 TRINITY_DN2195_c2_g1_i2:105-467(-)
MFFACCKQHLCMQQGNYQKTDNAFNSLATFDLLLQTKWLLFFQLKKIINAFLNFQHIFIIIGFAEDFLVFCVICWRLVIIILHLNSFVQIQIQILYFILLGDENDRLKEDEHEEQNYIKV